MRVSEAGDVHLGFFAGDEDDGGTRIECSNCTQEFVDESKYDEPCECPFCHQELFYRPWWEW